MPTKLLVLRIGFFVGFLNLSTEASEYNNDSIFVGIEPDTIRFLDESSLNGQYAKITNVSNDTVRIDSLRYTGHYFYYYITLSDSIDYIAPPRIMLPKQWMYIEVIPALPVIKSPSEADLVLDTLFVFTDVEICSAIVILDQSIISSVDEKYPCTIPANQFCLNDHYPNPFNVQTTLSYVVPNLSWIRLGVYNIYGQEIQTLVHALQEAGTYFIHYDAGGLSSGIYFYRIQIGNSFTDTKKMIFNR
jgi:hypothetical protein